jgi:cell division protein FtsZ
MSMSEIQEAAEIITSAVAPDANIIFGATLKPEMEDELIITVIATGFDSAYFHEQAAALADAPVSTLSSATAQMGSEPAKTSEEVTPKLSEEAMRSIDMDLDEKPKNAFADDDDEPKNIWHNVDEDESDTPAFLRSRKKAKKD